jgi:hypothetical protein
MLRTIRSDFLRKAYDGLRLSNDGLRNELRGHGTRLADVVRLAGEWSKPALVVDCLSDGTRHSLALRA